MMVIILTIIIWEIVKWGVRKVFDKKNKLLNNMAEIIISAVLIGLFGICLFGIIDIQRQIRKNDKK